MLATETRPVSHYGSYFNQSAPVARNITELAQSSTAPQLTAQLRHLQSGIGHINLDNNFLHTSKDWGNRFNPEALSREKQGASAALGKASGTIQGLRSQMTNQNIKEANLGAGTLEELTRDIGPHAANSADRIRQFCDHVGVTDRYTGYRNNLNRGFLEPTKVGQSWLNPTQANYPSSLTQNGRTALQRNGSRMAQSAPAASMQASGIQRQRPTQTSRSIQEQCGINMTFPGRTEYVHRYSMPDTSVTRSYTINPSPDFYKYGRPLAKLVATRNSTEYQFRYDWPDGQKLAKFPWLRK